MDGQFLFRDQEFQRGVDADIRTPDADGDQAIRILPDLFAELNEFVQKTVFQARRQIDPAGKGGTFTRLIFQVGVGLLDGRQQTFVIFFAYVTFEVGAV